MHLDDFVGMNDGKIGIEPFEYWSDLCSITDEHNVDTLSCCVDRPTDDLARGVVATHCINDDSRHRGVRLLR